MESGSPPPEPASHTRSRQMTSTVLDSSESGRTADAASWLWSQHECHVDEESPGDLSDHDDLCRSITNASPGGRVLGTPVCLALEAVSARNLSTSRHGTVVKTTQQTTRSILPGHGKVAPATRHPAAVPSTTAPAGRRPEGTLCDRPAWGNRRGGSGVANVPGRRLCCRRVPRSTSRRPGSAARWARNRAVRRGPPVRRRVVTAHRRRRRTAGRKRPDHPDR